MDNYCGYKCKICGEIVKEKKHFWKNHKISESNYFQEHLPKFDLLTHERIPFKSYEAYILTDFIKRLNLKKYIEFLSKKNSTKYLTNWLKRRVELKKIIHAPCEFELKNLQFPSISYLNKHFGDSFYEEICLDAGLQLQYNYKSDISMNQDSKLKFVVDTREQSLLKFDDFKVEKLDVGDYMVEHTGIFIERKSLTDFLGTMSKGYDRFKREVQRALVEDNYLIVLVEEKYANLTSYPYLPHTRRVKAEPYFIHHRVRELIQLYPFNIQFLAVDGRLEAARVIEKIFKIKNNVKKLDLQYFYDQKKL